MIDVDAAALLALRALVPAMLGEMWFNNDFRPRFGDDYVIGYANGCSPYLEGPNPAYTDAVSGGELLAYLKGFGRARLENHRIS